jgi:pimeloyl-ACP methyl ester carboxylesterase
MPDSIEPILETSLAPNGCNETDSLAGQANKVTDAVTGKILYCNGMTTSEELALTHAGTIEALTGIEVELHYNNTTSAQKALTLLGKLGLGTLAVCYALAAQKRLIFGVLLGRVIGLLGLSAFISGLYDINAIEKEQISSAQILANRVSSYLDAHPLDHITLILHSQGADIGHRALEKLSEYKERINVVTIGGMIDIPDNLALRVVNFVNDNDMIAYLAKTLFGPRGNKTKVQIKDDKSPYLDSHYSADYLKRDQVKEAILNFIHHPPIEP